MKKRHFQLKDRVALFFIIALAFLLSACTAPPTTSYDLNDIPAFDGSTAYVVLNDNVPDFSANDFASSDGHETYSALDHLGRAGTAFAKVGPETMPTTERGAIGQVKPSGWHTVRYDHINGKYLYNRCHLIGYQLTAENANERNLITGTRYLNIEGMLPFENMVADYIKETGNHVLYRVTPLYRGDDLIASGVQMEAKSVEDDGEAIAFNVYCYNNQPGVLIDYATGDSRLAEAVDTSTTPAEDTTNSAAQGTDTAGRKCDGTGPCKNPDGTNGNRVCDGTGPCQNSTVPTDPSPPPTEENTAEQTYILNTNSHKFHYPSCASVRDSKAKNRQTFFGSREELIEQGYTPCKRCNP